MSIKHGLLKPLISTFTVKIVGALAIFIMNFVVASNLQPSESGLFFQVFAIVTVLGMISTLGMQNSFVRFMGGALVTEDWNSINSVYKKGISLSLIVGFCFGSLIFLLSEPISIFIFKDPKLDSILEVGALAIPCFAIITLHAFAFQGIKRSLSSIFIQNILMQLILAFSIYYIRDYSELDGRTVTLVYVLSMVFTTLFSFFRWFQLKSTSFFPTKIDLSSFTNSSKVLFSVLIMNLFIQWGGQIIAGVFLPTEDVAFLALAQRVSMLVSFVLFAVNLVLAPRYAAFSKLDQNHKIKELALYTNKIMFLVSLPVAIILIVLSDEIMIFIGKDYQSASILLVILVLGQFINAITGSVGWILSMTGNEKDLRFVSFVVGGLSILLSLVLTPIFGVIGTAIAVSISIALQNLGAVGMIKKRLQFNMLKFL
jgi:O-antigen/teichoic acid export membrane protein